MNPATTNMKTNEATQQQQAETAENQRRMFVQCPQTQQPDLFEYIFTSAFLFFKA